MAWPAIPANAPCFMCLAAPVTPPGELPAMSSVTVVPQAIALGTHADGTWQSELEPGIDAKWRLKPATRDGVPFAQWHRMRVTFKLNEQR